MRQEWDEKPASDESDGLTSPEQYEDEPTAEAASPTPCMVPIADGVIDLRDWAHNMRTYELHATAAEAFDAAADEIDRLRHELRIWATPADPEATSNESIRRVMGIKPLGMTGWPGVGA